MTGDHVHSPGDRPAPGCLRSGRTPRRGRGGRRRRRRPRHPGSLPTPLRSRRTRPRPPRPRNCPIRKAFSGRHVHVKTSSPRACASATIVDGPLSLPLLSGARIIRLSTLMPSTCPTRRVEPVRCRGLLVGQRLPALRARPDRKDARPPRAGRCTWPGCPRSCSLPQHGRLERLDRQRQLAVGPARLAQFALRPAPRGPTRCAAKYVACLISSTTPISRPCSSDAARTRSSTSRSRRIGCWSSKLALAGRSSGRRSRQRSVDSSSHVKSSVNQPVSAIAVDRLRGATIGELGCDRRHRSCPRSRSRAGRRAPRPVRRRHRARPRRPPSRGRGRTRSASAPDGSRAHRGGR